MAVVIVGPDNRDLRRHVQSSAEILGKHFRIQREMEQRRFTRGKKLLRHRDLFVDRVTVGLVFLVFGGAFGKIVCTVLSTAQTYRPYSVELAVLQDSAAPEVQHSFAILEPVPVGTGVPGGSQSEAREAPGIREQA